MTKEELEIAENSIASAIDSITENSRYDLCEDLQVVTALLERVGKITLAMYNSEKRRDGTRAG